MLIAFIFFTYGWEIRIKYLRLISTWRQCHDSERENSEDEAVTMLINFLRDKLYCLLRDGNNPSCI
jgi:hypothetical protein